MQVVIKDVSIEWGGKAPKKWGKATVTYDYNGSTRRQNVMSFSNPDVFKKVQELVGETVDVEVGKNDKDFTEWRSISVVSVAGTSQSTTATASTGGTKAATSNPYGRDFETKEERALRQKLIVKQSSLSNAVAALLPGAGNTALDAETVVQLARIFNDWVLDTETEDKSGFDNMDNDIPF